MTAAACRSFPGCTGDIRRFCGIDKTGGIEVFFIVGRLESRRVAQFGLFRNLLEAHALDGGRGGGEVFVDHFRAQAERLENLSAQIALNGGDAHFGEHLNDALVGDLDIRVDGFFRGNAADIAFFGQSGNGLESHVRIDGGRTETDETGEVMHFAGLARFQNDACLCAKPFPDQVVVQP
jgi:hypothetical protein